MKRKSRIKHSGTLEKRGRVWIARWMVNGKRFSRSTGESEKSKALEKLIEFTDPYRLKSERRILEKMSARISGVESDIADAEDRQAALTFAEGWQAYEQSQSRPRSGRETMRIYKCHYESLMAWMQEHHPDITELRQVSREIAQEYAQEYLAGTPKAECEKIRKARNFIHNLKDADAPRAECKEYQKAVEEKKRIAARRIHKCVRGGTFNIHMNGLALIWRHVSHNPRAHIKLNPWTYNKDTDEGIRRIILKRNERPHTRRALTLEEVYELLKTAKGEMRLLIALGFYTGLRLGDICLLQWGNIDRVTGVITVRSIKTDVETRTVIHPALAKIIGEETHGHTGYLLPTLAQEYSASNTRRSIISQRIIKLFRSVGIQTATIETDGKRRRPDCTFHSLRHTFVSALRNRGVALRTAQELAGHTSAAMTMHYTHEDGRAALALPDVMHPQEATAKHPVALPFVKTADTPRPFAVEDLRRAVAQWTDAERQQALEILNAATRKGG